MTTYRGKANANHFFKAFEHCLKCKMNVKQAIIMGKGFSKRGLVDASEGCIHFAMRLIAKTAEGDNKSEPGSPWRS